MTLSYKRFDDAPQAAAFLAREAGARLLGGGTLLVRGVNEGDTATTTFVRVTDPAMKRVEEAGSTLLLGALVTMADVIRHPALAALAPAAQTVGGPAVREAATVGGNLFAPVPYGDFGVALLALDATVLVHSHGATVEHRIEDFFAARASLPADAIVQAVKLERSGLRELRFAKASRVKPKGASIVSIAACVTIEENRVTSARVALGAMAGTPIRAKTFEQALIGQTLDEDSLARIVHLAADGTTPPTDAIASAWYRQAVLPVHLRRLLLALN